MKLFVFEGTPEELKSARSFLGINFQAMSADPLQSQASTVVPSATPAAPTASPVTAGKLTEDVATGFFMRRALPKNQRDIVRAIKNAGSAGVTSSGLAKQLDCDVEMIKGAMRAFGKRAAHTEGWPKGLAAFIRTWEGSENRYRLHPEILSVLESGKVPI